MLRSAALLILLAACDEGSTASGLEVHLLDPTGANAAQDVDGELHVEVRQADRLLPCDGGACTATIEDGAFDLVFPIASLEENTWAHVAIDPVDGDETFGATPVFKPFGDSIDVLPVVFIVMERPSTCHTLDLEGFIFGEAPDFGSPRTHAGVVVRRNLAFIAGGDGDASNLIHRFDQLTFDADQLDDMPDLGRARGIDLNERVSIVVGDRGAIRFDLGGQGVPLTGPAAVHPGASSRSALVLAGTGGAVIAGDDTHEITWLDMNGNVSDTTSLTVARTAPAAVRLDEDILVVGGHADGDPAGEWVQSSGGSTALDLALPLGTGGVLLASPDESAALWIAFEVGGAPSAETWIIRDCPGDRCAAAAGPAWTRARSDVATVITAEGVLWIGGGEGPSRAVDLVYWDGDQVRIEAGPDLASPRANAVAFEHASGVVVFGGGATERDFEMCFPSGLDPLL